MLYDLMSRHRDEILAHSLRQLKHKYPERSESELMESLPSFVDQVIDCLRYDRSQLGGRGPAGDGAESVTVKHGLERRRQGFEIGSVVRDYALICEVVSGLA